MRPRNLALLVALAAATAAPCVFAQDATPQDPPQPLIDLEDAPAEAQPAGDATTQPADATQALEALVIFVEGRGARWRPTPEDDWRVAKVDDLLPAGAQLSTGLRSNVGLRVGKNATLLVDSASDITLAAIEELDGRLITRAMLNRGSADFKVDQVGLENDFVVLTPSSTLAVKGTGFRMAYGPMRGAEVEGLRSNSINAIELGYFTFSRRVALSGRAISSSRMPDPVQAALNNTVAPPPSTSPADSTPADAQGSSQSQAVRNNQQVAIENAALQSLLASFANSAGGVLGNQPPNPGMSGGPPIGPSGSQPNPGFGARPSNGPRPSGN